MGERTLALIGGYAFEVWHYNDGAVEYICFDRSDYSVFTSFLVE